MEDEVRVFLDTSALFAAVSSETGGARMILKLGEAGALQIWIGPWVLQEADRVIAQKSPKSKPAFALLLDRARVKVGDAASAEAREQALAVVAYRPDAQIIAEALTVGVDYLVSLDRAHLIGNPRLTALPFPVGTAGDCLAWYRTRLAERGGSFPL